MPVSDSLTDVMRANIVVHSRMVDEYSQEPHFRPENQAKVRAVLKGLHERVGGGRLLDLGCGTGFIINLAHDLFKRVDGVDITQAMLDKIDLSPGNIFLHNQSAENLSFNNGEFDLVTCYAFIHHVEIYPRILAEAFRVLRTGGILYVDLEPNRKFWELMRSLERRKHATGEEFRDIVEKEIASVLHTDEAVYRQFGIEEDTFNKAEYTKSILGGIDAREFQAYCKELGFSRCDVSYQWFLGQGAVMHGESFEAAECIARYLERVGPASESLYKYLRFIVTK